MGSRKEVAAHVRPRHEVIGALIKSQNDGVINNFLGQLQIKRVLDEVEHGLAA